ncbi:hypothetical protein T10_8237 [Trichinella papuae]|uniref:Uncharacterized protein n=1 Tax=Trichinella papuae TaxID=268474 RepID=A0A0V1MSU0_9BILA|nr:hypothetical protein T10_8237 [Trichinella papuae]
MHIIKVPTCVDNLLQLSGRQQLSNITERSLFLMTERGQLVTNMSTSLQILSGIEYAMLFWRV